MLFAAILLLATAVLGALPETRQPFLESAILADNADVALGRLAEPNASDRVMRGFGRALARNHMRTRSETKDAARAVGAALPSDETLLPEAKAEYDRLQRLTGADFDRGFLRYVIRDHRQRIRVFELQARAGEDEIAGVAASQLPTLKEELREAESVQRLERVLRRDRRNF